MYATTPLRAEPKLIFGSWLGSLPTLLVSMFTHFYFYNIVYSIDMDIIMVDVHKVLVYPHILFKGADLVDQVSMVARLKEGENVTSACSSSLFYVLELKSVIKSVSVEILKFVALR